MNSRLLKLHIENKRFDHGYLLAGDVGVSRKMAVEAAAVLLDCPVAKLKSHPDFSDRDLDLFGIKESNELKNKSLLSPFSGDRKVFIVELFSLTSEAANALLKIFEEPPAGTHFFVIVPSADAIIPTLRSRLTVINSLEDKTDIKGDKNIAEEFLKELPNKRLDMAKKIGKDKRKATEFLNGLEIILARQLGGSTSKRALMQALENIQKSRDFIADRAANAKMILEYLALTLPKV